MNTAGILSIISMVDAIAGSVAAEKLLGLITGKQQLTEEQQANLEANYRDYVERIARLRSEQG